MESNVNGHSKYAIGTYNIPELKIDPLTRSNVEVEVFRSEPINRNKPTAFFASNAFETEFGKQSVAKVIDRGMELAYNLADTYNIVTGHCTGVPSYAEKPLWKKVRGSLDLVQKMILSTIENIGEIPNFIQKLILS